MATKFQQGLADRIQIKKKTNIGFAFIFLILMGIGVYMSPSQWYLGVGFVVFFMLMFRLRMYAWTTGNEKFELAVFVLPTLTMLGALVYLYNQGQLNWGAALQIIASAPFSIILMRSLFADQINDIAKVLRKRFN